MREWRLIGAWLAVLAVTTTLTWQIVSAADDRVGERSGAPLNIAAPTFTTSEPGPSTSTPPLPTSTTVPSVGSSSSSSPTSSNPSGTSSSSTTPAAQETLVIPTVGGTVTVRVVPGSVTYLSAVPNPGFAVEVEDAGPPDVRVELTSTTTEVEVRVRWRDGTLDISVDVD